MAFGNANLMYGKIIQLKASRLSLLLGLCLGLFCSTGSAVPLTIINPSFESNPAPVPTDITAGLPDGWTAYNPTNITGIFYGSLFAAPDNYPSGAPDADHVQVNYIGANGTADAEFGVSQALTVTLEPNTRYTLSVEVGNIASGFNDLNATPNNPNDDSFFSISGFNGYRVELQVAPVGETPQTLVAQTQTTFDANPIPDGQFRSVSIEYDSRLADSSLLGQPLQILLVNLNEVDPAFPNQDRETNFDNVRLDAVAILASTVAVPIPVFHLVILGFGIIAWVLRKQSQSHANLA